MHRFFHSFAIIKKKPFLIQMREKINRYGTSFNASGPIQKSHIFDDFMNTNQ
jgi:hypothetical protein